VTERTPYVITGTWPDGVVLKWHAGTFDGLLAVLEVVQRGRPGVVFTFRNEDRAHAGDDGLTDAERERLRAFRGEPEEVR